ncbi:hypothetical protein KEM48_003499 [Puccinia striiformis f. sp. tritici PST-130]|nr:hypothetical protein H4Q26_002699 [Puccinia striiformis f. sp. tritici PST-130]KAI9607712.1 hypothetical protein KEM48_003499 [Puccinia striiformis f. sp. tritici PST-130]
MHLLRSTLLILVIVCGHATAFDCGPSRVQNVCKRFDITTGPLTVARADEGKPIGMGKNCKHVGGNFGEMVRGCCPPGTVPEGGEIVWQVYLDKGCGDPPRHHL